MRFRVATLAKAALAAATLALLAPASFGQTGSETFTATASVKSEVKSGTAPVRIRIQEYSDTADRDAAMSALKAGGSPALRDALSKMKIRGSLEVGDMKAPIRYAFSRPTGAGRIVTVVTAEPIRHLGGGLPDAKPTAGYDLAVALLILEGSPDDHGELSPAAKVKLDETGAIVIDDYGVVKVWLKGVTKAK
jgi:hypothetical protein